MGKKKSIGLPGGPNEFLQDITQYISVEGFKSYSPDKNNPVNIIESGSITMQDVDFPVLGIDNLGNSQMMFPENDYQFPGDTVFEIPKGQMGNLGSYSIKKEKDEVINKLNSETFLNRYLANYKHITGKDIDIDEAKKNIKNQIDFTSAGSDNAIVYPYTGSENTAITYSPYYGDGSGDSTQIKRDNAIASFETRPFQYGDDRKLASDIISKDAYNYPYSIGLQYDNFGDIRTNYGSPLKGLVRHELAHSYNRNNSPLFDDMIDDPTNRVTKDGKERYRTNFGHYDAEGSLLKVYEDLFGKQNFKSFNDHAGMPLEISSAKAETEGRLLDTGIWDYNKEKFGSSQFEKMLNTNEKLVPNSSEPQLHFQSMGFSNLKGMVNDLERFDAADDNRKLRSVYDEGYNISTIAEQDSFYDSWLQDNKRYSFEDGPYGDKSPYENAKYLVGTSKTKKGKKYKKALELVEGIDNIKNIADEKSIIDYRKGLEKDINDLRPEVERKMKIYFNELVQENNPNEPVMAQDGGSTDTQTFLQKITNPIRKNLAENLEPYGYDLPLQRLMSAAIGIKDSDRLDYKDDEMWWADSSNLESETERMDLLSMTMNQPQKYDSIKNAKYKPTNSKDPNAKYYRSVVTENAIRKAIKNNELIFEDTETPSVNSIQGDGYTYMGGVLGEYKIHKGEDEKGEYYSYYDKWDLNPIDFLYGNKTINKAVDKVTSALGIKPPEIYGRVYLNDLETEQTVGAKITQENIKEYRKDIKKQQQQFLEEYGYEAPKGIFSTNPEWDEKQDGGSITPELLMKQAYVESNWDPNIVNSKGYTGLGQIGSQLAEDYKKANKIKGDINLLDPKVNADIQKWSMNELMNSSFINKGNSTDEVKLAKALAAYNWGRGNMSKMLVKQKDAGVDIYKSLDWLSELPKETLEYYKMITTDNFNPETRPLMQQDYLKALENDSIIQNYYKKSGGEYSVFKDYVNGKYNNTKHENHAEKIYDKLNRIHYREAKEAGMSPANFIMTNISRYS